jgi:hypothetical protein
MTRRCVLRPQPVTPPCTLDHHRPGRAVGFHQWIDGRMVYHFGTVLEHHGRRIKIWVSQPVKTVIETECGHVFEQVGQ